jgi:hypothetical protein
MSVALTNFTTALAGQIDRVVKVADKAPDAAKAATVLEFIDSMIQGDGKPTLAATTVLDEAQQLVDKQLNSHTELKLLINEQLKQRRETHVTGSKHSLPVQLAKQIEPMKAVLGVLERYASKAHESYDKDTSIEVRIDKLKQAQNFFFHGLGQIGKEVASSGADEKTKSALRAELIDGLAKTTAQTYGKETTLSLVSNIQDSLAPVEIYTRQAQSNYKLPVLVDLENNADLKTKVEAFNTGENNLTADQKNQVLSVADKILKGEDAKLEYHSLSEDQKAYMEHLRQASEKLSSSTASIEGLISKLGEKLPDLLMPAIIGAIVGYLMGGMELVAGAGAVFVSFLGSSGSLELGSSEEKKSPPKPILKFTNISKAEAEQNLATAA